MKNILTLFLLTFAFHVISQVTILDRLEYDTSEDFFGFQVKGLENQNLLVTSKNKLNKKTYEYRYELFNKNLKKLGEHKITFQKGFTNRTYFYNQDACYTLRSHYKKGMVRLHTLNLKGMKATSTDFIFPKKTTFANLIIFGDYAYFKVYIKKQDNFIRKINLKTGKFKDFPTGTFAGKNISNTHYEIIGEGADKELLFVRRYYEDGNRNYIVQRFDKNGKPIGSKLTLKFNENFVQSLSFKKDKGKEHFLITGAFSGDDDYKPSGVFYAKVSLNGRVKFAKYTPFDKIDNFYSYLSERRQAKIQKKKAKAVEKGKKFELEYNVASHDIYEHNGVYYYIGEFYYPTYHTECYTTTTNGITTTNCRQVFDGYQYSHAVIHAFDENGRKLWGNTFEMYKTYKPFSVKRFVKPRFSDNGIVELMFVDYSWIESGSFKNGKRVGEPKVYTSVAKTEESDEEVKRSSSGTMNFWYDDLVFIYGFQKVKDSKEHIGKKKRKVYYINIAKIE